MDDPEIATYHLERPPMQQFNAKTLCHQIRVFENRFFYNNQRANNSPLDKKQKLVG